MIMDSNEFTQRQSGNESSNGFNVKSYLHLGEDFVDKIAFCVNAKIKYSNETGQPYVIFHMRDRFKVPFTAFMFNLEDLQKAGFDVSFLRSSFVKFSGTSSPYNGGMSFRLFKIERINEPVEEVKEYLGEEKNLEPVSERVADVLDFDIRWKGSLAPVLSGRYGGYVRLIDTVLNHVDDFMAISGGDLHSMRDTLQEFFETLYVVYETTQLDFPKAFMLDAISSVNSVVAKDALCGVLGVHEPETVLGTVLWEAVERFHRYWELTSVYDVILPGHSVSTSRNVIRDIKGVDRRRWK